MGQQEKIKKIVKVVAVVPFACESEKVSEEITKGFMLNVTSKLESLNETDFNDYVAKKQTEMQTLLSRGVRIDSVNKFDQESKLKRENEFLFAKKSTGMDPNLLSEAAVAAPPLGSTESVVPMRSLPPIPRFKSLVSVVDNQKFRQSLYEDYQIDYVVMGSAKKQDLSEMEFGNLETAATAYMTIVDLATGEILADEKFVQGYFEIVAPDRIGKKFAGVLNRKIKLIDKENKKAQKNMAE